MKSKMDMQKMPNVIKRSHSFSPSFELTLTSHNLRVLLLSDPKKRSMYVHIVMREYRWENDFIDYNKPPIIHDILYEFQCSRLQGWQRESANLGKPRHQQCQLLGMVISASHSVSITDSVNTFAFNKFERCILNVATKNVAFNKFERDMVKHDIATKNETLGMFRHEMSCLLFIG